MTNISQDGRAGAPARPRRAVLRLLSGMSLVLAVVASGCSTPPSTARIESPRAQDFCPEVIELLEEFDSSIMRGMAGDDSETEDELKNNAFKLSLLGVRASYRGVDLESPEADWLRGLSGSAQRFIDIMKNPEKYSEEETSDHLENILAWYEFAGKECQPAEI